MTDRDQAVRQEEISRKHAELQQRMLEAESEHADEMRDLFQGQESVIAQKVKRLRTERNWSQEHLADQMTRIGFQMHQTTIAKLEAGRRPITVSETYALAFAFGLDPLAMWYLPVKGEPQTLAQMREDLMRLDEHIKDTEQSLEVLVKTYAHYHDRRARLAETINEAAARYQRLRDDLRRAEENHTTAAHKRLSTQQDLDELKKSGMDSHDPKRVELRHVLTAARTTEQAAAANVHYLRDQLDKYGKE